MNSFLNLLVFRTIFVFASTAFSILIVMLTLNIITVDEVVTILDMSPAAANAFKLVVSRIQEVTGNIMDIISQLMNKLFSWAGVEVDLDKIKVDVHQNPAVPSPGAANSVPGAANSVTSVAPHVDHAMNPAVGNAPAHNSNAANYDY